MDPATATLLASAVLGGTSLFSSSENASAQRSTNRSNLLYSYLQQQDERAYNSPKAIIARLEDAGLNPNLIYGNGAGSLTSRTVSAIPAQAPKVDYRFDALGALSMYQNLKLGQEQIDQVKASTQHVLDQNSNLRKQNEILQTQLENADIDLAIKRHDWNILKKYPNILSSLQYKPEVAASTGALNLLDAFSAGYGRRQENLKNGSQITGDEIFKWLKEHPTR